MAMGMPVWEGRIYWGPGYPMPMESSAPNLDQVDQVMRIRIRRGRGHHPHGHDEPRVRVEDDLALIREHRGGPEQLTSCGVQPLS